MGLPPKKKSRNTGTATLITMTTPERNPFATRSVFCAPIFCAVKLDKPFPSVVKDVIAKVLIFIPAEYPATTAEP